MMPWPKYKGAQAVLFQSVVDRGRLHFTHSLVQANVQTLIRTRTFALTLSLTVTLTATRTSLILTTFIPTALTITRCNANNQEVVAPICIPNKTKLSLNCPEGGTDTMTRCSGGCPPCPIITSSVARLLTSPLCTALWPSYSQVARPAALCWLFMWVICIDEENFVLRNALSRT